MPSWGELLQELTPKPDPATGIIAPPDFDGVRHKYLTQLQQLTKRSTIVYATDWFQTAGPATSIGLQDMQGLMETFRKLPGSSLDLILHSPGGQAEATESLVRYMRSKFTDVRVIVPLAAMSAATMWASRRTASSWASTHSSDRSTLRSRSPATSSRPARSAASSSTSRTSAPPIRAG